MYRDCRSIERTPKNQFIQNLELFHKWHGKCQKGKSSIKYCTNQCIDIVIQSTTYQYDEESMLYHIFSRALPYEYIYLCDTKIHVLSYFWWDSESIQNLIFLFCRVAEVTFRWKKKSFEYFDEFCFECVLEYFRKIPIDVEFGKKSSDTARTHIKFESSFQWNLSWTVRNAHKPNFIQKEEKCLSNAISTGLGSPRKTSFGRCDWNQLFEIVL